MSEKPLRVAIVGSGVAGSLLAYGLSNDPRFEVFCFEKVAADDYSLAGTGLNISPNSITTLRNFYPEVAEDLLESNLPWKEFNVSLVTGEPLISLNLLDVADDPGVRIRWADLYTHCRKPVMDRITFATDVKSIAYEEGGETLKLTYTNSQSDTVHELDGLDLVVGADGRYSLVRDTFFPKIQSRLCGMGICRALFYDEGKPNPLREYGQWFLGAHRLLGFPLTNGANYCTATFPIPIESQIPPEKKSVEGLYQMFAPEGVSLCKEAKFILEGIASEKDNLHWARFQVSDFQWQDEAGHVLLLGDASHAMVPTLGQGATQAIEDACAAADSLKLLYDEKNRGGSVVSALQHYRERREARVQFCSDLSDDASDTLRPDTDVVKDTLRKAQPPFLDQLSRLYRDVPKPLVNS
ncbi:FAD-dependent monooxygenase [Pelagicoccus albus]|uniref:FAD-dependent monooxygenase n=1 Tax=Pelagicoccus albus TaxID=415222 RepID=A0A7X1BBI4_9BACT|nr:NAD(P)/FAD-dependent oxidoreductase [Pelagicoccus albus]MBC2607920.1 FAD-dependent monooxygenase [Pelagicoccus albus]